MAAPGAGRLPPLDQWSGTDRGAGYGGGPVREARPCPLRYLRLRLPQLPDDLLGCVALLAHSIPPFLTILPERTHIRVGPISGGKVTWFATSFGARSVGTDPSTPRERPRRGVAAVERPGPTLQPRREQLPHGGHQGSPFPCVGCHWLKASDQRGTRAPRRR
jgi:hypothetical protein